MEQEKYYSDKELNRIIRKAADLQLKEGDRNGQGKGFSLSEIEKLAGEAGIDPSYIRKAAEVLDKKHNSSKGKTLLGASVFPQETVKLHRFLGEEEMKELLHRLPQITGKDGQGSVFKGSLIWSSSPMEMYRSGVTLKVEGTGSPEGTSIKIKSNLEQIAGGIFGGIVGGVGLGAGLGVGLGVGLGALNSPLVAGLCSIGAIVISFFLSRLLFTLIGKNQENKLKKIAGFMEELLVKGGSALNTSLPDQ